MYHMPTTMTSSDETDQFPGEPFDSLRSLPSTSLREPRATSRASGHSPCKWLAMSEPGGLPKASRRASRMEAAGVEPASESTPSQASTCVAALECSQPPSKSDGNRRPLAPIGLAAARRNRSRRPACFYDIQPRPAGENGVDVAA